MIENHLEIVAFHLDDGEVMDAKLLRTEGRYGYLSLDLRAEPGAKYVGRLDWFTKEYVEAMNGVVPECALEGTRPGEWERKPS